jgi:hypothetical protein
MVFPWAACGHAALFLLPRKETAMGQTLTRAHDELFRRHPDERFNTMQDLFEFCQARKERSELLWRPADDLQAIATNGRLHLPGKSVRILVHGCGSRDVHRWHLMSS